MHVLHLYQLLSSPQPKLLQKQIKRTLRYTTPLLPFRHPIPHRHLLVSPSPSPTRLPTPTSPHLITPSLQFPSPQHLLRRPTRRSPRPSTQTPPARHPFELGSSVPPSSFISPARFNGSSCTAEENMVVDYYETLRVSPTAADEELRRSYKKLAMRWHPDKNPPATRHVAESMFKQICQAYDVLSDPLKRQIYDRYGEEGLKAGVFFPDVFSPSAAWRAAAAAAAGGGKKGSFRQDSAEAEDGFEAVFGGGGGDGAGKAAALEIQLACSLEELYNGCRKKMKISRTVLDSHGNPVDIGEVLAVDVEPGWKKGTRITFPGKGHHEPGLKPGDIIFVIDEKPHPVFRRNGNDLVVHHRISLLEALTGTTLTVTALDGRDLSVTLSDVVKPGHEVVIRGEGMPLSKDPKARGDLRIKFDVKFPSKLSADQKSDLRRVLGRSS